jgi:hypothetical protein
MLIAIIFVSLIIVIGNIQRGFDGRNTACILLYKM